MSKIHRAGKTREFGVPVSEQVVPKDASRYGLVIGIDNYQHQGLDLRCAVADAQAMFELMVDETCGCFPKDHVTILLNADATTRNVGLALSSLVNQAGPRDTVWIYYAGHAAVEGTEAYWVTHDTDVRHLSATGLDRTRINRELSRLRSERVLLLLDCCHAAATSLQQHALRAIPSLQDTLGHFEGKGVMTLAASNGAQKSVELSDLGRGAFTYYLEKGLRGDADEEGDRNGIVTLNELWRYVYTKVQAESRRANNDQTPVKHGSLVGNDMALTLNAHTSRMIDKFTAVIEGMVGIRPGQLSTEQGKYCVQLLHCTSRTDEEDAVFEALEEVARGELQPKRFVPLVEAALRKRQRDATVMNDPSNVSGGVPYSIDGQQVVVPPSDAVEVVLPIPIMQSSTHSVPDPVKPWGIDWRMDKFGLSTAFAIGFVVQRMRWIPPGVFLMGSPGGEAGRFAKEGQHLVTLTQGFWLGETPITQASWSAMMGTNPSQFQDPNRPVERVSWHDCQAFIEKINAHVPGAGFRLPTEAEWEYACRAGTMTATWGGDLAITDNEAPQLETIAWYRANSGKTTHPVRQKAPNPWGLYDMLGNVYEWCGDWYSPYSEMLDVHQESRTLEQDPVGPAKGIYKVLRGGSWFSLARGVRAALRDANTPDFKDECIGFRLARCAIPNDERVNDPDR